MQFPNNGQIALDYQIKNRRGTIAMARQPGPDTATSQFFINFIRTIRRLWVPALAVTATRSSAGLWTAWKWLTRSRAFRLIYQFASPFGELPLKNCTNGAQIQDANKVIVNSISIASQHASFQNPIFAPDTNNDGNLNSQDALLIINDLLAVGSRAQRHRRPHHGYLQVL